MLLETPAYHLISDPLSKIQVFFLLAQDSDSGIYYFRRFLFVPGKVLPDRAGLCHYFILFSVWFRFWPFLFSPDEDHHFYRICGVVTGPFDLRQTGHGKWAGIVQVGEISEKIYVRMILKQKRCFHSGCKKIIWVIRWIPQKPEFCEFANTALYAPPSYLPQIIQVKIANILTDSPLFMAYLGRPR